jgi:hypothetical protein
MTDSGALREEITFLTDEIRSLKSRIGSAGNAVQLHKLEMLTRLRERCERSLKALAKREQVA